jgi:hypothetical protein
MDLLEEIRGTIASMAGALDLGTQQPQTTFEDPVLEAYANYEYNQAYDEGPPSIVSFSPVVEDYAHIDTNYVPSATSTTDEKASSISGERMTFNPGIEDYAHFDTNYVPSTTSPSTTTPITTHTTPPADIHPYIPFALLLIPFYIGFLVLTWMTLARWRRSSRRTAAHQAGVDALAADVEAFQNHAIPPVGDIPRPRQSARAWEYFGVLRNGMRGWRGVGMWAEEEPVGEEGGVANPPPPYDEDWKTSRDTREAAEGRLPAYEECVGTVPGERQDEVLSRHNNGAQE